MYIHALDWDEKNENHVAEHEVTVSGVEEAIMFGKPFYQRSREGKYIAYAVTEDRRYFFIIFVVKGSGRIRVVSAEI